jgi:hypothetical protein
MNRMEKLLDKLERRLKPKVLVLPEELGKDAWANEVIANETLDTFSRFFPNAMPYMLNANTPKKNGYYILDTDRFAPGVEIIGVADINWDTFSTDGLWQGNQYGMFDYLNYQYSAEDVALMQGKADLTSLFNNQIMCDFKEPNMVRVYNTVGGDISIGIRNIPIMVLMKHAKNLMTIPQTMMETFEALAECDVAGFLYQNFKYFDNTETAYANLNLMVSEWQDKYNQRDDIVQKLDDAHVSAANKNMPMIITV